MPTYSAFGTPQLTRIARLVESLAPDRVWVVTVSDRAGRRTLDQNARFHAVVERIAHETGNTPALVKEALKAEFGPRQEVVLAGQQRSVPKPSSAYSEQEMSDMIDRIEAWAATELGIIP